MNESPLSILFITNNYTPYSGGVVTSINALTLQLQKQGHTVNIATLDFLDEHNDPPYVHRLTCPVKFSYKTKHMAVPLFAERQIEKLITKLKPDIIHSHHPFLLGTAGLAAAKKYNLPVIFTHHSRYEHYLHYLPLHMESLSKPVVQALVKKYCDSVDMIIAPTNSTAKDIKANGTSTQIITIPSSVDERFYAVKEKRADGPTQLLSVSRFAKEKNIYFLLDMLAGLPQKDFNLTLIGYGPEQEALENYAYAKLKLNNVTFIEKPSKEILVNQFFQADIFVFASQSETQGIVLAEAMASSTPVVALHGPGQDDLVQPGYNGYLIHSIEEMRDQLKMLHTDTELMHQLGMHAFESAQEYRSAVIGSKIEELYYKILTPDSTF